MTTNLATIPNGVTNLTTGNNNSSLLPSVGDWQTMIQMAGILVKSGFLPASVKTVEAAVAIMLKGRELGLPPMQAFASIHIISGKPTLAADLMVALLCTAGHKVWVVTTNNEVCVMKGHRRGEPEHTTEIKFDWKDAERAAVTTKTTWQQYPAAMLYARCASRLCRMIAPDVLAGIYTPEELGAEVSYRPDGQEIIEPAPANKDKLYEDFHWGLENAVSWKELDQITGQIEASSLNSKQLEKLRAHYADASKRLEETNRSQTQQQQQQQPPPLHIQPPSHTPQLPDTPASKSSNLLESIRVKFDNAVDLDDLANIWGQIEPVLKREATKNNAKALFEARRSELAAAMFQGEQEEVEPELVLES